MISPQSLGDDVLCLLVETNLRRLHIVQNSYTPVDVVPVSYKTWLVCAQRNPNLQVHLQIRSNKKQSLVWQEAAPVHTILLDSPKIMVRISGGGNEKAWNVCWAVGRKKFRWAN